MGQEAILGDMEHRIKREGQGSKVKGLDLVRPWSLHANREQHPELISDLFPSASRDITVMEIWVIPQAPVPEGVSESETFKIKRLWRNPDQNPASL